ncbi:Uncharacterized RNA methyltransferase CT0009 [Candidatus Magnetomoraceae bacterium gMMP-13]
MTVKKGQDLELDVSDIAIGGRGLAKVDGFAVFVDKAVAGDRVIARVFKKKKSFVEARTISIIKPSLFRVNAPCQYSGYCGGCKWQFLDYNQQLIYKRQHVSEAIKHIGLLEDVVVHPVIPSKLIFGYRNKMEFSCSDRRWLLPDEMGQNIDQSFAMGLHVPGTFNKVLDTKACLLQPAAGNEILCDIRDFMKNSDLPAYGLKSHKGFWRFCMLRHSYAYDQWMVNIVTAQNKSEKLEPLAEMLRDKYPQISSVMNNITSSKAGVAIGQSEICLAGSPYIKDKIGAFSFKISANSFFQTNTRGAQSLYEVVKNYAELSNNETILDLYSGTGTIPIWLSNISKKVIGIELIKSAVEDAGKNCKANNIENCQFIMGDIKDSLSSVSIKPDLLIIDPPRAGMHKDVVKQVMEIAPPRIIYVSCNPASLARDLGMMKDSYQVLEVQPVDMFPHTYHVESVARLVKK